MEHAKNCTKNNIACLVDHNGGKCPGYGDAKDCSCSENNIQKILEEFKQKFSALEWFDCPEYMTPDQASEKVEQFISNSISQVLDSLRENIEGVFNEEKSLIHVRGVKVSNFLEVQNKINLYLDQIIKG